MTIIRVKHNKENPYVVMNKTGLNDPNLSFKAKGVLAYLLSKPDDWIVYVNHLATQSTDGKSAVRSALKELITCGYAIFERERDTSGSYISGSYTVYETPRSSFPNVDNPNEENRTLLSNDYILSNDSSKRGSTEPLPPAGLATVEVVDAQPTVEKIEEAPVVEQQSKDNGAPNKNHLKYELSASFSKISSIPQSSASTPKRAKAVNALWWTPLLEMAKWCEWDADLTTRLMRKTIQKMAGDRLTISNPKSILNVATSIFAEYARRKTEYDRDRARMEADPQYQAGKRMREREEADVERTIAANKAKAQSKRERVTAFMGEIEQKSPVNSFG